MATKRNLWRSVGPLDRAGLPFRSFLLRAHIQLDPGRRVVACAGPVADPAIDAGTAESWRQFGVEQKMIDAQSRILLPVLTEIIPEGVDAFVRIASTHRIGPSLSKQSLIALATSRL